jgi:hypothetical protein
MADRVIACAAYLGGTPARRVATRARYRDTDISRRLPLRRIFGEVADEKTTSYTTPFGQEYDRRNAHLDALPGRRYRDWFESLNRASLVFSGNSRELEKHLTQFVGSPMFVSELPEGFGSEAARLLHNYLSALATLRDIQRGIHRRVWPDLHAPGTDDKRTKWEVEVWAPKIEELFGSHRLPCRLAELLAALRHPGHADGNQL